MFATRIFSLQFAVLLKPEAIFRHSLVSIVYTHAIFSRRGSSFFKDETSTARLSQPHGAFHQGKGHILVFPGRLLHNSKLSIHVGLKEFVLDCVEHTERAWCIAGFAEYQLYVCEFSSKAGGIKRLA